MPYRTCLLLILLLAGCDALTAREPEPPGSGTGPLPPANEPSQVVANLHQTVRQLAPESYRLLFADGFTYTPAADAGAEAPALWAGWNVSDEEGYFRALAAATPDAASPTLALTDPITEILSEDRASYTARYRLVVPHRLAAAPDTVAGRLRLDLLRAEDGLWAIDAWTDESDGAMPSWSTLRAAFLP